MCSMNTTRTRDLIGSILGGLRAVLEPWLGRARFGQSPVATPEPAVGDDRSGLAVLTAAGAAAKHPAFGRTGWNDSDGSVPNR